ncbi:MAG TPA: ACP S-malonyltransferase [Stellaceae bacterium]|nr:ACP S-malonyltransferase [Stellaceae bacterium]
MTKRTFVFPGQGSQAVGMGAELVAAFPLAREIFQEVDDALEQHLSKLMREGPEETLTLTENAQPALLTMSIAILRVIEREGGFKLADKAVFVAGHSLGEYSALAAAGAFSLADAARLVKRRGLAMQRAVPVGEGAMAALIGVEIDIGRAIAEQAAADTGAVCAVANDNGGGQLVLSGAAEAVNRAIVVATERGVKRAILLQVSAPFHSPLMAPAADEMAEALSEIELKVPSVPVVANVTAEAVKDPDRIRPLLVEQVTGLVRWRESIGYLKQQGVEQIVELGAGKVLSGLVRRIDREFATTSVATPAEVEAVLKLLS